MRKQRLFAQRVTYTNNPNGFVNARIKVKVDYKKSKLNAFCKKMKELVDTQTLKVHSPWTLVHMQCLLHQNNQVLNTVEERDLIHPTQDLKHALKADLPPRLQRQPVLVLSLLFLDLCHSCQLVIPVNHSIKSLIHILPLGQAHHFLGPLKYLVHLRFRGQHNGLITGITFPYPPHGPPMVYHQMQNDAIVTHPFTFKFMTNRIHKCQGCKGSLRVADNSLPSPRDDLILSRMENKPFVAFDGRKSPCQTQCVSLSF